MGKYSFFKTEKESDVICVEFRKNLKVDETIAKQLVSERLDFIKNKNCYYIIDLSNIRHISSEAKFFMQHSESALGNILGVAFIASNPVSALLANVFVKTEKKFPSKFFAKITQAFDWITELKKMTK